MVVILYVDGGVEEYWKLLNIVGKKGSVWKKTEPLASIILPCEVMNTAVDFPFSLFRIYVWQWLLTMS